MLPMRLASSRVIAPMRSRVQRDRIATASTTSAIIAMGNIALKSMETSRNLRSLIQLQNLSQIPHPHQARSGTNGSAIVFRVETSLLKNSKNALPKRLAFLQVTARTKSLAPPVLTALALISTVTTAPGSSARRLTEKTQHPHQRPLLPQHLHLSQLLTNLLMIKRVKEWTC